VLLAVIFVSCIDFKPLSQGRVVIVYQPFANHLAISERLPSAEMSPEMLQ
jgi:hypothetical protein